MVCIVGHAELQHRIEAGQTTLRRIAPPERHDEISSGHFEIDGRRRASAGGL